MIEGLTETEMKRVIQLAITKERMENPDCPMAWDIFPKLLEKHKNGDPNALALAYEIAEDTLRPPQSFGASIKHSFSKLFTSFPH